MNEKYFLNHWFKAFCELFILNNWKPNFFPVCRHFEKANLKGPGERFSRDIRVNSKDIQDYSYLSTESVGTAKKNWFTTMASRHY